MDIRCILTIWLIVVLAHRRHILNKRWAIMGCSILNQIWVNAVHTMHPLLYSPLSMCVKYFLHWTLIRARSHPFSTFFISTKSHLREIQVLFINSGSFFKLYVLKLIPINYTSNTYHCSMNSQITNPLLIPFELREYDDFDLIDIGIACNGGHNHMQKPQSIAPR